MNICSHFVDKEDLGCYNNDQISLLFRAFIQNFSREGPSSLIGENEQSSPPCFTSQSPITPYKEDMQQEKQKTLSELLKLLAITPNGDKYMQFVLQLAEESVTKNTLASLIDSGKLAANNNSSATVGADEQVSRAESKMLGKLSDGKARRVFTIQKKEFKNMPEQIRKLFIANDFVVFYRIKKGYYEARLRRGAMYIEASGKTFEIMRKRFIERLQNYCDNLNLQNQVVLNGTTQAYKPILFTVYAEDWLSIKKQTTKPSTYQEYERTFNKDLKPHFKKRHLHEISRSDLQKYLFDIVDEGKNRKAEKLALMLTVSLIWRQRIMGWQTR